MPEDANLLLGSSFMTIKGLYTPAPVWQNFDIFFNYFNNSFNINFLCK